MGQTVFSLSKFSSPGTQHDTFHITRQQSSTKEISLKLALQKSAIFLLKAVMKIISHLGIGARNNATATATKKLMTEIKLHFSVLN